MSSKRKLRKSNRMSDNYTYTIEDRIKIKQDAESRRQKKVNKILSKWDIESETLAHIKNLKNPKQRVMPESYIADFRLRRLTKINSILGAMFQKVPEKFKERAWNKCLYKIKINYKYKTGDLFSTLKEILADAKRGVFIESGNDKQTLCP